MFDGLITGFLLIGGLLLAAGVLLGLFFAGYF